MVVAPAIVVMPATDSVPVSAAFPSAVSPATLSTPVTSRRSFKKAAELTDKVLPRTAAPVTSASPVTVKSLAMVVAPAIVVVSATDSVLLKIADSLASIVVKVDAPFTTSVESRVVASATLSVFFINVAAPVVARPNPDTSAASMFRVPPTTTSCVATMSPLTDSRPAMTTLFAGFEKSAFPAFTKSCPTDMA